MEKSELDPFKELRKKLEKPVKLSEAEKKKIEEIFTDLNKILEGVRKDVLEMDQPEAYRYMEILFRKFYEAKVEFEGKIVTVQPDAPKPRLVKHVDRKPGDFREYFNKLDPQEQETAQKLLGCIKSALQLEADGGNPSELLCSECNLEAMKKCIQGEDPNVKDEMDRDGEFHIAEDARRGGGRR